MPTKDDVEFLALLVHRRKLSKDLAEAVFTELQRGGELDPLLEGALGCSASEVAKLRRTRAGEIPEIPGYEVIQKIGSGGTADVFRVHEKKSGRVIALKVLRDDQAENAATKKAFIEEAKLLEKLRHAGLVEGYGAARYGELYFSRLEYIDGRTLLEMLDDDVRFDETQALRIVLTVAEVLAWLGAHAVVHRDIKPGNIMLASDGRVKLIDLGFAACEGAKARNDKAVGTVQYLSPEQCRGGAAADTRSDIYSLGVTLFHLVVGRLPFDSSDDREVLRMQVMQSLSSPELKSRGLSHHLHYFIEKMMAKEVELRYQTWQELIDDVQSQLAGRESLDFERDAREKPKRNGRAR
ncbi:MAG: serine/threonine protein kinase [Planctomycetes bacterium]|nr:serine/threonine protein kinase [Planctomycetota bacterium]